MSAPRGGPYVIIGTSGSTDYLKDTTGNRRYWPVSLSAGGELPRGDEIGDDKIGADLVKHNEDDYDGVRRDESQEME